MKTKLQILIVLLVGLAVCGPAAASPKPKASPSPSAAGPSDSPGSQTAAAEAPAAKSQRAVPFHGMIAVVDSAAKTFTIAGKEHSRTFKITESTKITKAGQPATAADVVANEEARGSYTKAADGTLEVKTLKVGPQSDQEKAADERRKSKREAKKAGAADSATSPEASPSASASPR